MSHTLTNFFGIKNVLNHVESFSTCKKLHLDTIARPISQNGNIPSDRGFSVWHKKKNLVSKYLLAVI